MRRLVLLALGVAAAWWLRSRRRRDRLPRATIGYEDGSSVTLESGAPELERLAGIAEGVLRP